ncbi:MAG: hypothetical protein ACJ79K_07970 [Gemmatimonadaceae bacterium]
MTYGTMIHSSDKFSAVRDATQAVQRPLREQASPAEVLLRILELFDRNGIPYCVVGGAERLSAPGEWSGDLDCVVPPEIVPDRVAGLLHRHAAEIGADVVRWHLVVRGSNHYITLASLGDRADPVFINLDLHSGYVKDAVPFLTAEELLRSRLLSDGVFVPAPAQGFAHRLLKRVLGGSLPTTRGVGLSALYAKDPAGCEHEVRRFCAPEHADVIIAAASSGDWTLVISRLDEIGAMIRRRFVSRHPVKTARGKLAAVRMFARKRIAHPQGVELVLLGPDGVGKTTVIERITPALIPVFDRVESPGPAPAVLPWSWRSRPIGRPHALPVRPAYQSIPKALFWLVYYRALHLRYVRGALKRGSLVLYHRSLLDALVDQRRYRYGGPIFLLRWVIRMLPRPDLVCVLDAPAEVVQQRKQEVPAAETARQRAAYRALAAALPNALLVDASRPVELVARDVTNAILRRAAERSRQALEGS